MSMAAHIARTLIKAEKTATALCRLMPKMGGPRASKRRLLSSVVHSIALYGVPFWFGILQNEKCRRMLVGLQRRMAIRVCSAYRTASTEALLTVAGIPPRDRLAVERVTAFSDKSSCRALHDTTLDKWQDRWQQGSGVATRTKSLIPDVWT
nr:unnamed protein product [Callosobruchus analis]